MINLDGQISKAVIEGIVSPHGGGIGRPISGTILTIQAELATPSKDKVKAELLLGVLATRKIRKIIGKINKGDALVNKRIEIIME